MRSDEALLEALLDGDVRGFDLLHARYARSLFGFIRRHHPQQQEAEDLLHETFLALLRDREGARTATNLKAWLFQVARHLCLNRHRAQRRAAGALADPAATRTAASESHPEKILLGSERQRALGTALARLPLELAELWHLRSSGLSYEEMASVLAVPVGTVKSRMHGMVHRLREELRDDL
jgi:RNA polymerase sigma-70 factor (ECF subfamily)